MRLWKLLTSAAIVFSAAEAGGQVLTCATGSAEQCNGVHFHVQVWNPETKGFAEIFGQNSFANVEACEALRKHEMAVNQAALEHLARTAPRLKAQAAKYGPCHCDMTGVKVDPHYLDEQQRAAQLRRDREAKLAMLKLLLEHDLALDSDLARAHISAPPARVRAPYWSREAVAVAVDGSHLLDPASASVKETSISAERRASTAGATLAPLEARYATAVAAAEGTSAAETAIPFIDAEMSRMSALLESVAVADGDTSALLEASNERLQVLTNLVRVIESGGSRTRLAAAAQAAVGESDRRALIQRLFGELVAAHWAPENASAMLFTMPPDVARDPVSVLRDASRKYSLDQRKLALFALLARSASLTDSEGIWLSGIADTHLNP